MNSLKRLFSRSKKAVSPVIATIIIVAIAIVMSIAVAYWLMGFLSIGTEKLQFVSGYATSTDTEFTMNLQIKNMGSKDSTIDMVFLNGKPTTDSSYDGNVLVVWNSTVVKIGDTVVGTITLDKPEWSPGISVDVNIHTVAGYQYPKTIVLP